MTETIYIVDDDDSVRRALERMFRASGFSVHAFGTPLAFLAHGPDVPPCCAVIDLLMPQLDGVALRDKLREAGRMLPVVFISGELDPAATIPGMQGGTIEFIRKPFENGELMAAVRRALDSA